MPRYFLTKLSVEGFRGINNEGNPLVLSFKPDAVNSVFAANGSGKSSLFEALQFAFRGSIARLSEMQAAENSDSYIANLFHTARESTIEMTLTPDGGEADVVIVVRRTSSGTRVVTSPTGNPAPEKLLEELSQEFALLDYGKFAKFIADTALDRGRSFSSLLGLSDYADFRRALKSTEQAQTFKSDFDVLVLEAKRTQTEITLDTASRQFSDRYKEVMGKDFVDFSLIEESTEELLASLSDIPLLRELLVGVTFEEIDFKVLNAAIVGAENSEDRVRLVRLVSEKQVWAVRPADRQRLEENVTTAKQRLGELDESLVGTAGSSVHALLEAAETFFESEPEWNVAECPLCDSTLTGPLDIHVSKALESFAITTGLRANLHTEITRGALYLRLIELENLPSILEAGEVRHAPMLLARVQDGTASVDHIDAALVFLRNLEERVAKKLGEIASQIEQIEKDLPPSLVGLTAQVANVSAARDQLRSRNRANADVVIVAAQLAVIARWKGFIAAANSTFADAEARLSQATLEALKVDYQTMFRGIMSVGDVVPALGRSATGEQMTVELADFHGHHDVSARALLSESYRNALAISVFLSAAVRHGKAPRFVVLDDVTSSFDSGHQFRLMEQVRTQLQYPTNPDGLQFIMLSHDVALEKYFDRLGDEPGWHHQKLQGWPPHTPVSAHGQNPDRLRADAERFLRAGQIDQGASLIRQYLEFVLLQVIRKVQIPVPIDVAMNDHSKMVGTCLEAVVSAVLLNQRAGTVSLEAQQILDLTGRHGPSIVANWISHYGTAGSASFSPPSLIGVLNDIDALRRCFQYDVSGSGDWRFYKSLTRRS